jgi:hypothetical protein
MSTGEDTLGIARDHRWMRLAEQQSQLKPASRVVVVLGDAKGTASKGYRIDDIAQIIRPGTVVQVMYAFLLADTRGAAGKHGRVRRAAFDKALAVIENRKGLARDMLTGLTTETPAKRLAFKALAYDQISRSNRGLNSAENGDRSQGRPSRIGPAERQIIWEEWHSALNRTNGAAAAAACKRMGFKIGANRMWNIVKEERAKRGIPGKGASGRRPNVKALEIAQGVRRAKGVVYFLKNGKRKQIKIGFGVDLNSRIETLRASSPETLQVLATIPGDRATEGELHRRFAKYRIRREWFKLEGELAEYVAGLRK